MDVRQVLPADTIPSVDDPVFDEDYEGDATDRVVVVDSPDRPRAYPLRYLHYHEIVNDTVDGEPLAVTWCPLCGSAVVYERTVDGQILEFGVSGKLADDDLVMYDRETESEWKQSSGRCIAGTHDGRELTVRPAAILTWEEFEAAYSDGVVLQPPGGESEAASADDTPSEIEYDSSPYDAYFESDGFGLGAHRGDGDPREWDREDLSPKAVVLGLELDGEALAFPLSRVLDGGGVVQTTVGSRDVVVFATDTDGIHAFVDPGYEFTVTDGTVRGDGTSWNPATGEGDDGRRLDRLPARRLFAFAWQDDHGPDVFFEP